MKETQFTKRICKELEVAGCRVRVLTGNMFSKNNPDRLVVSPAGIWLIEFKGVSTKVTAGQTLVMADLNWVRPGTCYVARQLDAAGRIGELNNANESWTYGRYTNGAELLAMLKKLEMHFREQSSSLHKTS